jgi:hypothetical protein
LLEGLPFAARQSTAATPIELRCAAAHAAPKAWPQRARLPRRAHYCIVLRIRCDEDGLSCCRRRWHAHPCGPASGIGAADERHDRDTKRGGSGEGCCQAWLRQGARIAMTSATHWISAITTVASAAFKAVARSVAAVASEARVRCHVGCESKDG